MRASTDEDDSTFFRRRLLLLVDDDVTDAVLLGEALRDRGHDFDLRLTPDCDRAIRYLLDAAEPKPDLVIVDLYAPLMDVRSLLDLVRNDPALRRIPVVVLTVSGLAGDLTALGAPADAHFVKPVDYENFLELARYVERLSLGFGSSSGENETWCDI